MKRIRVTESELRQIIKEAVLKEVGPLPAMVLTGRRQSSNVEDRRADNPSLLERFTFLINRLDNMNFIYVLKTNFSQEKHSGFVDAINRLNAAYKTARSSMGNPNWIISMSARSAVNRMKNGVQRIKPAQINEDGDGDMMKFPPEPTFPTEPTPGKGFTAGPKTMEPWNENEIREFMQRYETELNKAVSLFETLVKSYVYAVINRQMSPFQAMKDVQAMYKRLSNRATL